LPEVKWFDLHVHSNHSYDGKSSVEDIIKICRVKGIDGVAMVDHETVAGLKPAMECAKRSGVLLIPGFELKTKDGDIAALFIDELPNTRDAMEVSDFVKGKDGLLIMPHPYRASKLWMNEGLRWDAVEGLNGRSNVLHTMKAYRYASKHDYPKIAGSDAHESADVGKCMTGAQSDDLEDLRKRIKTGDVRVKGMWASMPNTFRSVKRRLSGNHE
jgi:hypothetical protein